MVDALYRAHFTAGVDVGSREALAALATEIGLDVPRPVASSTPTRGGRGPRRSPPPGTSA